jgi:carbonic anhydrase
MRMQPLRSLGFVAMSAIDDLLAHNASLSSAEGEENPAEPARRLAIVTCMDARLDLFGKLGVEVGDAHVLRNAGGVVTDDVIRSLAISQRRLGTQEVMLIHHTDCGMLQLSEAGFRNELQREAGLAPPFAIEAFSDLDENLRQSILRVRRSPFLPFREVVRGFVYEVERHRLREVIAE